MPHSAIPDDPFELVRGLMHGDRATLKLGYTAASAALAATSLHHLSAEAQAHVTAHAHGYAAGLRDEPAPDPTNAHSVAGHAHGLAARERDPLPNPSR